VKYGFDVTFGEANFISRIFRVFVYIIHDIGDIECLRYLTEQELIAWPNQRLISESG